MEAVVFGAIRWQLLIDAKHHVLKFQIIEHISAVVYLFDDCQEMDAHVEHAFTRNAVSNFLEVFIDAPSESLHDKEAIDSFFAVLAHQYHNTICVDGWYVIRNVSLLSLHILSDTVDGLHLIV